MSTTLHILHVEDNFGDALLVQEYCRDLESFKVKITHVINLEKALAALSRASFDVIFLDLGLPDSGGVDAVQKVLSSSTEICLIVLSGNANMKRAQEAMSAGAQDYLLKDHLNTYVLERSITYSLERLRVQKKVAQQNEKLLLLETAVGQSANSIVITNIEGTIEYVNDKVIETTGFSRQELLGQNPRVLKSGAQPAEFYNDLWDSIKNGKQWQGNFKNKRKDGTYFWEKATISPVLDDQGNLTHYVAIKENITEQKMMADRLNFTLDAANIGSWEWNIIDDYVEHNDIWFGLIGFEKNEIESTHHTWQSLIHPEDFENALSNLEVYLEGNSDQYNVSYRMQHKLGHYIWVYDTGQIIERDQNGKPTRMLGLHLDITDVKNREIKANFERSILNQSQAVSKTGSFYYSAAERDINYTSQEFNRVFGDESLDLKSGVLNLGLSKIHPDDLSFVKKQIELLQKGEEVFFEHRAMINGKLKWHQVVGQPRFDKLGRYVGALGVLRDVTTQKKYEYSLQENLQKNIQAQMIANFGYWEVDLASGHRKWSSTLMDIFSIQENEVPKTFESYLKWVHPKDVEKLKKAFQLPQMKASGKHVYRILVNNEEKWIEDHWQYYPKKKDQPERTLGVIHDITARKRVEEELAETNARLKAIFGSMKDLIFINDLEGNYIDHIETNSEEATYVPPSVFLGKNIVDVLPKEVSSRIKKLFEEVKKTGKTQSINYYLIKENKEQWYSTYASPLIINKELVGFCTVSRNITTEIEYRNRLMESQGKLWMQSEFLPHISFTTDAMGKTTYINKVGKEFYGNLYRSFQEGKWTALHKQDVSIAKKKWVEAQKKRINYVNLERHLTAQKEYRWLQVNATPVMNDKGEITSWIGISTDVNEQILLHQKNEKLIDDLSERVKESQCLFDVAQLGHEPGHNNIEVIEKSLDIIPNGFLKPKIIQVRIIYQGEKYQNKPFRCRNRLHEPMVSDKSTWGELFVCIPARDEDRNPIDFSREEKKLVKMLASTLALIFEKNSQMKEVEASESRFKALINKATFGVGVLRGVHWVEMNQAFLDLLQCKKKEIIGKTPWDISPKYQPDGKLSKTEVREMMRIQEEKGENRFYWQHQTQKGKPVDCDLWLVKHIIDSEELTLVFVRDITKELKAQKSLKSSEIRFKSILEHATVGISVIKDSQFIDLNVSYAKSLGYEKNQLLGEMTSKIRPEVQSDGRLSSELIDEQFEALKKQDSVNFKMEHLNAHGTILIMDVHLTQMEVWGEDTFIGFTIDITDKEYIDRYMRSNLVLYKAVEKNIENLKQVGIDEVLSLTNSRLAFIYGVKEEEQKLRFIACDSECKKQGFTFEKEIDYGDKDSSFWHDAITEKNIIQQADLQLTVAHEQIPLNRTLKVPVIQRGRVVALLVVANKAYSYSSQDIETIQNYAKLYYSLLEKKQIEEELIETSLIFQQSQKVGRIGAWRYNFNDNDHWWSDVMYELFGLPKANFAPSLEKVNKMVYPNDLEKVLKAFDLAQKTGDLDIEYRIIRPDGKVFFLHAMAQMSYDEKGKPLRLIGLTQNITEIRKVLSLVEEKSKQYEAIVESLPGVVYRFRYDDIKLLYVSDYYTKLFGDERFNNEFGDSSLDYIKSLIHADDFERVEETIIDAAENKTDFTLKCRMIDAEGKSFWVSNTGKSIVGPDGELIIEGFIYDITERVRAEERIMNAVMEASDREKSKISKEIHDSLQQTLTVASLNLEFVKREKENLSERIGEKYEIGWSYLKKALDQTRSIAHSLMPKAIEDFGVIPLLNDMFEDLNKSSDITFEFITNLSGQRLKINIETNVYKIVQEATNNILKHAQANQVTIQYIKVGDMIQLSIEDDGKGFDKKKIDASGGGFGLASMKSRAGAISAEFFVDSYIGRGTSLMIEFPFTPDLIYYE